MSSEFERWVREKEEFTAHRFPELFRIPHGFQHMTEYEATLIGVPEMKRMSLEQVFDIPITALRSIPRHAIAALGLNTLQQLVAYLEINYPEEPESWSRPVRENGVAFEKRFPGAIVLVRDIAASLAKKESERKYISKMHETPLHVFDDGLVRLIDIEYRLGFLTDETRNYRFIEAVFDYIGLEVWRKQGLGPVLRLGQLLEYLNEIRRLPEASVPLTEVPMLLSAKEYAKKHDISRRTLKDSIQNNQMEYYLFEYETQGVKASTIHIPDIVYR